MSRWFVFGARRLMDKPKAVLPMLLCLVFGLAGCGEVKPDLQHPVLFEKDGLSFQYPGNWRVSEGLHAFGVHYQVVESPAEAIVIVHVFSDEPDKDLMKYAKGFSDDASEETPVGSIGPSKFGPVTKDGAYDSVTEHFEISLLGQTVPHVRVYKRKIVGNDVCFLVGQVAVEDHEKVKPGFALIFKSFQYKAAKNS